MANKALIHLLVIFFLALSHIFFFPSHASRLGSLMEKPKIVRPQQDTLMDVKKEVEERMVMELNDYPGSGANNRHLPRQRGCVVDC
ncbi:putative protein [Arabidopsis thaliana]|jgi:hypothetical protein|uniref:Transmembrane protein n=3 Tax=Arabidopsis TaxID=3701 RepID=Q9SN87_ARATH|nr:uncharacterized protein AT3G47510 [Arabidopsis thaliana]KAG7633597.1 hypothetical protein ISN44_As03g038850 [Arabidopsis suecica]AEE78291.1 transmembrane protein [Arabidopsis thaliana]CAA0384842.1 unnamed protein product [Arabidopsis thaliana]CAB61977.1 putative protein [Arabidopsis thaliana]CAD5325124.1 unnamed protein product [Arabidopsis thaliana]|eukprot:NP_190335.1 transmembrane protein [Arabidopsis thaliana]